MTGTGEIRCFMNEPLKHNGFSKRIQQRSRAALGMTIREAASTDEKDHRE